MPSEIAILLPCHSFEDFPTYHTGQEAEQLLACWSALWHPKLIAQTGKMPKWHRADSPPDEVSELALAVPSISRGEIPSGFLQRAKESGAIVVQDVTDRQEIYRQLLNGQDDQVLLRDDFLALGYCYLQTQLMTRQLRYSSSLDEIYFEEKTVEAAQAAVAGDETKAKKAIQACFDVLMEERNQYYSVDAYLLDFTLCAETTLGGALSGELKEEHAINLFLTGQLALKIKQEDCDLQNQIIDRLNSQTLALVGGLWSEGPLNLLDPETLLQNFVDGHQAYLEAFGRTVRVFGRRRFGLTNFLPQILKGLGYIGAIHSVMDEGKFPTSTDGKVTWEGCDGSTIDALAKFPLDATKAETFLTFYSKLGEAMDGEHVATLAFAHWPGAVSPWYDDLKCIAKYSECLGSFTTVETYFEETDTANYHGNFQPEDYRSPWLQQSVIRRHQNPVSTHRNREQWNARTESLAKLKVLRELISGHSSKEIPTLKRSHLEPGQVDAIDLSQVDSAIQSGKKLLAEAIPRNNDAKQPSYMSFNTQSSTLCRAMEIDRLSDLPANSKHVIASGDSGSHKIANVQTPGHGFVQVTSQSGSRPGKQLSIVDGDALRNEFMEVHIHPKTGGIKSIYDYKSRGNRCSQQLALRTPTGGGNAEYSQMQVQEISVAMNLPSLGIIQSKGELVGPDDSVVAEFEQKFRLFRNSRVLEIEISLNPKTTPKSIPWDAHFCSRLAWGDESAATFHDVQWVRSRCQQRRIEASNYIDIETSHGRTSLLSGGIPFHLRAQRSMLDSILIPFQEQATSFRVGIGIDIPQTFPVARDFLYQLPAFYDENGTPAAGASSWLFHLTTKNVTMTSLESRFDEEQNIVGFVTRLLETEGRNAQGQLQCFRPVAEAHMCDFHGNRISQCKVEGENIHFQLAPGQWYSMEVVWD